MPNLSCWSCGRQIYTVAPLEALFAEERRCPRCGAFLQMDRRETERRVDHRRKNPVNDPGPPKAAGAAQSSTMGEPAETDGGERRTTVRRSHRRRGTGTPKPPAAADQAG